MTIYESFSLLMQLSVVWLMIITVLFVGHLFQYEKEITA